MNNFLRLARVQMPDELKLYQMKNEAFSVSGISSYGQEADFIHEEINKLVKIFYFQECQRLKHGNLW